MKDILWEGSLEPASEEAMDRIARDGTAGGRKDGLHDAVRDLPLVSIGKPEVWALTEYYPLEKMPQALRSKLGEADFYLARFPCSFRPVRKESEIEWARFLVRLLPDDAAHQPVAYDLHPLQLQYEVKRNVKVALSPALKFQEIEAQLGGVEFGFEYPELQPVISATGIGENSPCWDYEEAKGMKVQGGKWMHLLLKAPKGTLVIRAILDVTADVRVRSWQLPVVAIRDKEQARAHLTVRLV
jgi:hypothetical protein